MAILWGTTYPKIELQTYSGGAWSTDYSYTFSDDDEVKLQIKFEKIIDGDRYVTESGKIIEYVKGYRLVVEITWRIFNRSDLTEFLRKAYNWIGTDKRIMVNPRPTYMNSYECVVDKDWDFAYPNEKWIGHYGTIRFISKELLNEIPAELGEAA